MALDWSAIEENAGGNYKPYAPDGEATVTVKDAQARTASTGTVWIELLMEDGEKYAYPKVSHPLSFKNDNWRAWHFMNILKELGVTEANAKKAIEVCESKSSQDAKVSAYEQTFKRIAAKHPTISIMVSSEEGANGKAYARGEFKNPAIAMPPRDPSRSSAAQTSSAQTAQEMLSQGEEITISEDLDLGF